MDEIFDEEYNLLLCVLDKEYTYTIVHIYAPALFPELFERLLECTIAETSISSVIHSNFLPSAYRAQFFKYFPSILST